MDAIADRYHWGEAEILNLNAEAGLHYAMRCARNRWREMDDVRRAAEYAQIADDKIRRQILEGIIAHVCGPGIEVDWKQTLTPEVREKVAAAAKELDDVYEQLKRDGLLKSADGKSIPQSMFGRTTTRRSPEGLT